MLLMTQHQEGLSLILKSFQLHLKINELPLMEAKISSFFYCCYCVTVFVLHNMAKI